MSIEGALLKLSHAGDFKVPVGESFVVPLKLARSPGLAGKTLIELSTPGELSGLIEAAPMMLAADKTEADLTIQTKQEARLIGVQSLSARATVLRDGYPVISECEIEIEFVPPTAGAAGP
jgi:hypothetical protein